MTKVRLRTKFLLSLLLVSAGLTFGSLVIVRQIVKSKIHEEVSVDLRNSTFAFQDFQQNREDTLSRSAELLSHLPSLKALMTTQHAATIQDASIDFWKLVGSNLFVLTDRNGKIVALHTSTPGFSGRLAQESIQRSLQFGHTNQWWYGGGHLYEVFLRPIYLGPEEANDSLGLLAVGYEIDGQVVQRVRRIAGGELAFRYDDSVVISTFPASEQSELAPQLRLPLMRPFEDVELGNVRYLATSLELAPGASPGVQLIVFKSYDQATQFLSRIYRFLVALGLVAVISEGLLVFLISRRFTRPLETLVGAVRALDKGDFSFPLEPSGSDEVAEVTVAFDGMRGNLRKTQQQLIEAERLATIGRMASSISHDLRHQLTAIVANSEFLSEPELDSQQRNDLYQEVRLAVSQMTDLIDSLLEFSRTKDSLSVALGSLEETMRRAIRSIHGHPDFHEIPIRLTCAGSTDCYFDQKKIERAFYNLLLNACQAVAQKLGTIDVNIRRLQDEFEITVADDGPGIPVSIKDRLFEPFVSHGKENGTGLGLTIVQKVAEDHAGRVTVGSTHDGKTIFRIRIPALNSGNRSAGEGVGASPSVRA